MNAVGRGPEADSLAAAARNDIAREPGPQAAVIRHYRVSIVGAVARYERCGQHPAESGPAVGRVGYACEAVRWRRGDRGVVIVDHDRVALGPKEAAGLGDVRIAFEARDNVHVEA